MDEQDGRRHEWAAPEDSPWTAGSPGPPSASDAPDADGPPPPPWERRRQRRRQQRRRIVAIVVVVALVLVVPLTLMWAGVFERPDDPAAEPTTGPTQEPGQSDPEGVPDPDAELTPPDPDDFSGSDADFATVLAGVEASERVMLRYQRELGQASALIEGEDLRPFLAAAQGVAEDNAQRLADAREALEQPVDTAGAERVREIYLDHLDAWLAFMEAAAADPALLGPNGETGRYNVEINATAVDFSRALETELPEDAAPEINRFAEDLLDRGFRFDGQPQV